MDKREHLKEIFRDTEAFYKENPTLVSAVQYSMENTRFYAEDDYPQITARTDGGAVTVTKGKTFETAIRLKGEYPDARVTVLNFASATNPGGGVRNGSSAQEESLCRCSTLYPVLDQRRLWDCYYLPNRAAANPLHTDACIYSPDIVICKSDAFYPQRLEEKDFVTVDIVTCAAPNLRSEPSNIHNPGEGDAVSIRPQELFDLHLRRAKHILHVAAANGTDVLVLGAFGCGAFCNDPKVVAAAYAEALKEYAQYFLRVDFAIHCREWETENYTAFKAALE